MAHEDPWKAGPKWLDPHLNSRHVHLNAGEVDLNAGHVHLNTRDVDLNADDMRLNARDAHSNAGHVDLNAGDPYLNASDLRSNAGDVHLNTDDVYSNAGEPHLNADHPKGVPFTCPSGRRNSRSQDVRCTRTVRRAQQLTSRLFKAHKPSAAHAQAGDAILF